MKARSSAIHAVQHFGQSGAEAAQHRLDVALLELFEVMLRDAEGLRTTFDGMDRSVRSTAGQVERA